MEAVEQEIRLQITARLGRLCIARPAVRNALSDAHWAAIAAALDRAAAGGVRVLWLEGQPGAFSAGADIAELKACRHDPATLLAHAERVQAVQQRLERAPMVTLALIDGVCMGGGLGLALCCDLRLATPESRFALAPARLGLRYSPRDCRRLANAVGLARAREMLLTGRELTSEEALAWGLVNELVPADALAARADELSAGLLASSGDALLGMKRTLAFLGGDDADAEQALWRGFREAFASADFAEGASAFLEKRPPRF